MKGDFSKDTYREKKHFHDVKLQQGRVLLDSDWNEQAAINEHRVETGTLDIIGNSGAPFHHPGFEIIPVDIAGNPVALGTDLKILEGRFYVDGVMCENDVDVLFADQPDFDKTALPGAAGRYIFYLDVWQRHITAVEDNDLREVALGGPDTTTRSKTLWQVKYVAGTGTDNCADLLPARITDAPTGKLMAKSEPPTGTEDPCGLAVSGGYRRLENQLYRVEIHKGANNRADTTFKWSRDNGSVVVKWESIDTTDPANFSLVVSSPGRDDLLGFKGGDWIEIIDDRTELLGLPGLLAKLSNVDNNVLFINPATIIPAGSPVILSNKNARIRRWDSAGEVEANKNDSDWIELEDGVQIQFKDGTFQTGDYWQIPARTIIADIEWPFTDYQPPKGIRHHYAMLSIFDLVTGAAPGWVKISDCRPIFPPLTNLVSLYYVGGDGQEAMPGKGLPATLKVGVANGQWAVTGARVKFEVLAPGGGTLNPAAGMVTTGVNGIAECGLILAALPPHDNSSPPNVIYSVQVKASLLDAADNVAINHLPVIFNAGFSMAENVSYNSNCTNWPGAAPDTVAKALDELCERKGNAKSCCYSIGPAGDFKTLLEAIRELHNRETDICLCFMPGDHAIEEDILMHSEEIIFNTLKITGFTAHVKMTAKRMELEAKQIILQGISLESPASANNEEENDTQILLSAKEINMDYCSWVRGGRSGLPFVIIFKPGLVYLMNNRFIAFFSLIIANGVQGIIENNLISYLLIQNGQSNPFRPVPLLWLNVDAKKLINANLVEHENEEINLTEWSLTIRGNRIGILLTDVNREKPQDLYQDMIVSENIFQFAGNSFAGKFLQVVNNQFLFEQPQQRPVLAFVIGFHVIVIGNSGVTARLHGEPSGLVGSIEAIVLSRIVGGGEGQQQLLNLVNVIP